jgi:hypothetical protein
MQYYPLTELGFDEKYIITEHGEIINLETSEPIKPNSKN